LKKKKNKKASPVNKKKKGTDSFVDQFLAGKIVGMSDEDAFSLAVFMEDED
jgi:hypothetical protein